MRRSLLALTAVAALIAVPSTATAAKKPYKSCGDVNHKIGTKNYKLATKVQVKGLTCAQSKVLFITVATGEGGTLQDPVLEELRYRCKDDKSQAAAQKKGRIAMTCTSKDKKHVAKAWVLGG